MVSGIFLERFKKKILKRCYNNDLGFTVHALYRLERIELAQKSEGEFRSYKQKINLLTKDIAKNIENMRYQSKQGTFSIQGRKHYYIISKDIMVITIGKCQCRIE